MSFQLIMNYLGSPVSNIHAWPAEHDKEVHAVNANAGVIPEHNGKVKRLPTFLNVHLFDQKVISDNNQST